MNLQKYNILVVDDDRTLGESVKTALTRAGFRSYYVASPEDALAYVKLQDVHGLVIDCMLPKMNGLELFKHLKDQLNGEHPVVLMSGIFKDRQFISSSRQKTGALEFFIKPFNPNDLISVFSKHFGAESGGSSELNPLVQLYMSRNLKPRQLIRTINGCEGLHNFDLPFVISLLNQAQCTGHLNIACTNGDIAGVGFDKGQIVQVNIKNEESLLGLLLCEHGFLDREDLEIALEKAPPRARIGQVLIGENYVSPHAIDIVLKEQIMWRMRRLIADSQMELNFVSSDEVVPVVTINNNDLTNFFSETIDRTLRTDWLRTHYLPITQNIIALAEDQMSTVDRIKHLPFVSRIYPALEGPLNKGTTIEELLAQHNEHDEAILKVLHFFNILNCLKFTQVQKNANLAHQINRLTKLEGELERKNYFERLGVSRSAKEGDIKRAYFDLAKVLHPDKLGDGTPERVQELSQKVFAKIQVAYDTLKKENRREAYLRELEVGQAEKLIQADQLIEHAKNHLAKGENKQANEKLKQARSLNPDSAETLILSIWCDLKAAKNPSERLLKDLEKRLQQVPLQARDTPNYYHTRGLFHMTLGDTPKAIKYFKTALSLDSSFINSRRELSKLETKKEPTNIFQADIKDVVGMLFKRR